MNGNLQGKKGPEVGRHIKLYLFFHGKNFMPIPVMFEIKIKDVLNPFVGAFHSLWRTKSAGLERSIWGVKMAGKDFFLSDILSLNSMHAYITR